MIPAFTERGSGDTAVFFLHGIGGGKRAFARQMAPFAEGGYRAVAWDQPGYGDSATVAPYDWATVSASLAALVDRIGARTNVIVGHSMGGMAAQEFAARHPGKLHGLVLSGTSPAFGKADGAWQQAFVDARLKPLAEGRTMRDLAGMLVPAMLGDDADPAGAREAIECMASVPPATYAAALAMLVTFDRREALAAIRVPTLVLAGERDGNAPPAVMEKMAAKIPGSRYVMVPGMGHLANMERPATFNEIVLGFIDEHVRN